MPYRPTIPQPTDRKSVSQGQIQENYNRISTWVQVDHVNFDQTDEGKHNATRFVDQGGGQPGFTNPELGLYSVVPNNIGGLNITQNEMYIRKARNGANSYPEIPFTASSESNGTTGNSGWSYLPSGLIMKWNRGVTGAAGSVTVTLPNNNTSPAIPNMTVHTVQISLLRAGQPNTQTASISNLNATPGTETVQVTVQESTGGAAVQGTTVFVFAIGA